MLETIAEQRAALNTPVDPRFICKKSHVKGPFTTGDYIRWKLNQIFGPDNWSHIILEGPELVKINDLSAYVRVTVRLTVQFANDRTVIHDDIGVSILQATRGSNLDGTSPERYETVVKAAITDGVKACAEYLGICFRPIGDESLDTYVRGQKPTAILHRRDPSKAPSRKSHKEKTGQPVSSSQESNEARVGPTEFWSRFAELERQGLISADLRHAAEVKQFKEEGDWSQLLSWLEQQTKRVNFT